MSADQFANATLLVNELKVAMRAGEGANSVSNSEDLARVLAESVSESGTVETGKALKLRAEALDAIREEGSSGDSFRREGLSKGQACRAGCLSLFVFWSFVFEELTKFESIKC
ncbi:flavonol 7-O-rhamnosyltransferase-like isoform X1 [Prosopis cineraria]|uniref:flavonol 7-O-rhamnosyltransferase-like isoform X1 n=1 Tax=Prosopis cineraria TaxID=364024 RepID=UPI00240EE906|nr:flavonol 7-O-rhamnosyltransferase-like isoform X1 [Prosopis cineraria]